MLLNSVYERAACGKSIRLSKSELNALYQALKSCDKKIMKGQ